MRRQGPAATAANANASLLTGNLSTRRKAWRRPLSCRAGASGRDRFRELIALFALVDVNAMFASCAAAEDPSLRGLALVVAGDPSDRRSIVLTASYEARAWGVRTAMPVREALRLCPQVRIVPPDRQLYERYSRRLFEVLHDFTPVVRPVSIDEGYLDLTGCPGLAKGPLPLAAQIRRTVQERTGLLVSIGLAEGPWLAKMAADLAKKRSEGILLLRPEDVPDIVWPLAVEAFHGIGPKTAAKLRGLGIGTIGDIARAEPKVLEAFGVHGRRMRQLAMGEDRGGLPEETGPVSISHEETFAQDIQDRRQLHPILVAICDRVGERLRREGYVAKGLGLRLRNREFRDFSRQGPLRAPSARAEDLRQEAEALLARMPAAAFPCRLLGVTAHSLERAAAAAPELFPDGDAERRDRLWHAVTAVRQRFGPDAVKPLGAQPARPPRRPPSGSER